MVHSVPHPSSVCLCACVQRIAGWQEGQVLPAQFWDHHFIVHRRFQHVLKDLDYTLQTTGKSSRSAIRRCRPLPELQL